MPDPVATPSDPADGEQSPIDASPDTPPNSGQGSGGGLGKVFSGLRVIVSTTVLSRFLGMFRDMATASLFGLGPVMDAFSLAFRIPNLTRRLFGEGALSAAFLPAFTAAWETDPTPQKESAWRLASAVFGWLTLGLSGLVVVVELLIVGLCGIYPPDSAARLLLGLTGVMLPYTILICLAAQITAVLHARGEFTWPALVPIVLNVGWIASIFLIDPLFEPDRVAQAYALGVCVVLSGIAQLGLQIPPLFRAGFRWIWTWHAARKEVSSILRAVLPVALGLSITQITTVMDSAIAWAFSHPPGQPDARLPLPGAPLYPLAEGATSALYFGERLYHFPLGVFGVALGTVLFPRFAQHAARRDMDQLRSDLSLGLRLILTVGIPAGAGLGLIAVPLTEAIYARGEFSVEDAHRTAGMIRAYAWGVWAYCAIPVLFRGFYAVEDRIAPLVVGLATLAVDLVLNLLLIWPLGERGLAWSTSLSSVVQVAILLALLQRRFGRFDWRGIAVTALRTGIATVAMSVVCEMVLWGSRRAHLSAASAVIVAVPLAIAVFYGCARLVSLGEVDDLIGRRPRTS